MTEDEAFTVALSEALAMVAAYVRGDNAAVLALLDDLPTRHDVAACYTVLAQLLAVHIAQTTDDPDAAVRELALGLQIDIASS